METSQQCKHKTTPTLFSLASQASMAMWPWLTALRRSPVCTIYGIPATQAAHLEAGRPAFQLALCPASVTISDFVSNFALHPNVFRSLCHIWMPPTRRNGGTATRPWPGPLLIPDPNAQSVAHRFVQAASGRCLDPHLDASCLHFGSSPSQVRKYSWRKL